VENRRERVGRDLYRVRGKTGRREGVYEWKEEWWRSGIPTVNIRRPGYSVEVTQGGTEVALKPVGGMDG